jgi:hypothetical protein
MTTGDLTYIYVHVLQAGSFVYPQGPKRSCNEMKWIAEERSAPLR